MPEPVLTSALLSVFESALVDDHGRRSEDAISQQTSFSANSSNGSNLPLRKPPSLSTLAMPSFAGARAISDNQRRMFSYLISQLPEENRDLIYTVVELIKITVSRSKETKMPLGNLLLIFCPSLNMSPSLLRVLCEADGIWDGPPARPAQQSIQPSPKVNVVDSDYDTRSITHSRSALRTVGPTIDLRLPVIELDDAPDNVRDSPDDAASFVSALEPGSNGSTRTPSPLIYGTNIPPLLSSDSLDSSSVSEELVSPDPPSWNGVDDSKSPLASANSLFIPEVTTLPLVSPRPVVPIPFPSAGGSVPPSPVTLAPLSHRKSYTLLAFPHLRSESTPDISHDEQGQPRRAKRPSLHLLFSKKSSSSLPSSASEKGASAVLSGSTSTVVSPGPHAHHVASSPPRLDTDISSSPIQLGFNPATNQLRGKNSSTVRSTPLMMQDPEKLEAPPLNTRSDSGGSSLFSTPQSTPIADFYRGRTTSLLFPDAPDEPGPPLRARSASQVSNTPSINIDVAEMQQEDWTQSVLLAAQGSTS